MQGSQSSFRSGHGLETNQIKKITKSQFSGAPTAFSSLSLSRSVPATPPSTHAPHPSLSPDVVEVAEAGAGGLRWSPRSSGVRSVPHSYRQSVPRDFSEWKCSNIY